MPLPNNVPGSDYDPNWDPKADATKQRVVADSENGGWNPTVGAEGGFSTDEASITYYIGDDAITYFGNGTYLSDGVWYFADGSFYANDGAGDTDVFDAATGARYRTRADGSIYSNDGHGNIYSYDATTGEELRKDAAGDVMWVPPAPGSISAPLATAPTGDRPLYAALDQSASDMASDADPPKWVVQTPLSESAVPLEAGAKAFDSAFGVISASGMELQVDYGNHLSDQGDSQSFAFWGGFGQERTGRSSKKLPSPSPQPDVILAIPTPPPSGPGEIIVHGEGPESERVRAAVAKAESDPDVANWIAKLNHLAVQIDIEATPGIEYQGERGLTFSPIHIPVRVPGGWFQAARTVSGERIEVDLDPNLNDIDSTFVHELAHVLENVGIYGPAGYPGQAQPWGFEGNELTNLGAEVDARNFANVYASRHNLPLEKFDDLTFEGWVQSYPSLPADMLGYGPLDPLGNY